MQCFSPEVNKKKVRRGLRCGHASVFPRDKCNVLFSMRILCYCKMADMILLLRCLCKVALESFA